jgi:preprotein translocase subunit Sss1
MRTPLPESRICRICGEEFKPKSRLFRCKECINRLARETRDSKIKLLIENGELIPHADRKPEEMKGGSSAIDKKYRNLKRMCSKMDRDEFKAYAKDKLNQIMENQILWDYLSREGLGESIDKTVVKEPKLSKKEKFIQRGDTRNMNWDEFEQMGFGLDEDK